jgi:hypothetical protein
MYDIMAEYGLSAESVTPIVDGLMANKDMWVKVCCPSLELIGRYP